MQVPHDKPPSPFPLVQNDASLEEANESCSMTRRTTAMTCKIFGQGMQALADISLAIKQMVLTSASGSG